MTYRQFLYDSYVDVHQGIVDERRSEPALAQDVLRHLSCRSEAPILDVGCGQGQLIRLLRARGYTEVSGIDVSPQQVELARRLGTPQVEQADLFDHCADHASAYDVVVAMDVVEHFDREDVPRVFRAFWELLRPGGTFIFRTPNGSSPYAGRYFFGDLTHGLAYTRRSAAQACAAAGFGHVAVHPVRPAGNGVRQRARRALWAVIEAVLTIPLIVETGEVRGHIVTQNLLGVAVKPG
jgi:2-polyprenyl-3-methyl-5-hydroxy-6-metoxy-1,4-benzoquinol methylase